MSTEYVVGDEFVSALATQKDLPVYGLTLVCNWEASETLQNAYGRWAGQIPAMNGTYIYPSSHLHVTIATLSNFRTPPKVITQSSEPSQMYQQVASLWAHLLEILSKDEEFPTHEFEVSFDDIVVSPNAGFFMVTARGHQGSDPIEQVRKVLARYLKDWIVHPPSLPAALSMITPQVFDELMRHVHIPGIKHSTFLRFTTLSPKYTCSEILQNLKSAPWPCPIKGKTHFVSVALESQPFMHIPKDTAHIPGEVSLNTLETE